MDKEELPETIVSTAMNGHRMEYVVVGRYPDGKLRTRAFDAVHHESCKCATWDVDDWGDLL